MPNRRRVLPALVLTGVVALTAGCGAGAPGATTPAPSSASAAAAGARLEVRLSGGGATRVAEPLPVKRGQVLHVVVTSDREDQVHLHGLDTTIAVGAGQTVERDVVVDAPPGLYEVETHNPVVNVAILAVS